MDRAGREFAGELLDVSLARDGSVTRVFGEGDVMVTLPSSADAPARVIQSRTFEAKGGKGGSLTDMRFTDRVVFRETGGRRSGTVQAGEVRHADAGIGVVRGSVGSDLQQRRHLR